MLPNAERVVLWFSLSNVSFFSPLYFLNKALITLLSSVISRYQHAEPAILFRSHFLMCHSWTSSGDTVTFCLKFNRTRLARESPTIYSMCMIPFPLCCWYYVWIKQIFDKLGHFSFIFHKLDYFHENVCCLSVSCSTLSPWPWISRWSISITIKLPAGLTSELYFPPLFDLVLTFTHNSAHLNFIFHPSLTQPNNKKRNINVRHKSRHFYLVLLCQICNMHPYLHHISLSSPT